MNRFRINIKETNATIICDERYIEAGIREIIKQRKNLEDYLNEYPDFRTSLLPVAVGKDAPVIVKHMARSSAIFGTGPMSAVAGAIAQYTVRAMIKAGAEHVIVDNGGDIAMKINYPVTVGIYAGQSEIRDIGLRFMPRNSLIAICTSSGTVGHSLSFGCADAATVIAGDALIADAAATVLGNDIKIGQRKNIRQVLERHLIPDLEALIVMVGDVMAFCGKLPTFVDSESPLEIISW